MTNDEIIDATKHFVQQTLVNAEGGHDWWHTYRVWQNAKTIGQSEDADTLIVELASLLHDIADAKFNNGDEEIGPLTAMHFLQTLPLRENIISHIVAIIRHMSFKGGNEASKFSSAEMAIVQDADRLDAIGAIGVARAFNYGGFKNRKLYDPQIAPNMQMDKETYKKSDAPTINHFYEKLLLLKDKMNTRAGRHLAAQRHTFLEQYLEQFLAEWEGKR